jgi:cardiolipin synthase
MQSLRRPGKSRRWLARPIPRRQLERLAPPRPKRLGAPEWSDRLRTIVRAWQLWLGAGIVLLQLGWWPIALVVIAASFVLYHASTPRHPAAFPLDTALDVRSSAFRETIEGVTGMPFVPGNQVTVYNNADEFYPAMLTAIESAQASITMEQYIMRDDAVGRRFADAFAEKSRQGVQVKLLLDAIGSAGMGNEMFQTLESGGCQLAWFHPIHWYTLQRANQRDHRKSIVIDGRIAFSGGAGLADHWVGTSQLEAWRDIQVATVGPAAIAQQSGFAQNWLETTGEILSGPRFFPARLPAGSVDVQTILSAPSTGAGAVGTMYLTALQSARQEILIANPYFVPDSRVIAILAEARRRGVVVTLLLAGEKMDIWWARQNSIRRYGRLLEIGVTIYEYQPSMLHQKVMLVDGTWASIGTANFDNRSFALNEETNLCFCDRGVAEALRRDFTADLQRSAPVDLARWRARGPWHKAAEQFASLIEDQI